MTQLSIWLRLAVVLVLGLAFAYALPNILTPEQRSALPSFLPRQMMTLGLDLQGGAHLVMEVQLQDVMVRAYENLEDEVRAVARDKKIGYSSLRAVPTGVQLVLREPAQLAELQKELGAEGVRFDQGGDGETLVSFTESQQKILAARALQQTVQVLRSRVDEFGVAEPVIQQQGDRRVIVELPGVQDVNRAKAAIGRTAQLTFHLVDETANPADPVVAPGKMRVEETVTDAQGKVTARTPLIVQQRPALTGELLTNAAAGFDQYGGAAVDIAFDARGTRIFSDISTKNVGKRFAIVLDGKVYSAPVFREPILGGRAQVSGHFTTQEAQDLAAILNAGALPAKVEVVEERTIGPSLGSDSVKASLIAMVAGLIGVVLFMVVFYGLFGVAANVALIVNLVILVAVMSMMGFTLTLPGMAGIVLTLGMAVDANVLIFERMREEVAAGRKPLAALMAGFEGAFRTILDGHVTTLVAAVALFAMGTGPVKGFAVSLTIGLLASLFTSVTLTRWILLSWFKWARPRELPL